MCYGDYNDDDYMSYDEYEYEFEDGPEPLDMIVGSTELATE